MKCNHCGYDTAMNAAFCPRCGATPPHGGKQAYDGLVKILGTILGIAVLGPSSASGKPQEQARCRQLSGSSLPRAADWLRGRGLARRTGACGSSAAAAPIWINLEHTMRLPARAVCAAVLAHPLSTSLHAWRLEGGRITVSTDHSRARETSHALATQSVQNCLLDLSSRAFPFTTLKQP